MLSYAVQGPSCGAETRQHATQRVSIDGSLRCVYTCLHRYLLHADWVKHPCCKHTACKQSDGLCRNVTWTAGAVTVPYCRLAFLAVTDADMPLKHGLSSFWSRKDNRPGLGHTVSCGNLGQGTTYAAGQHSLAGTEHELTLSRGAAAGLASIATMPKGPDSNEATPTLTPDFSARIVVSGFNIEASSASRTSARLDTSPSSFSAVRPGAAAGSGISFGTAAPGQSVSPRVGSLSTQLQPGQPVPGSALPAVQAQLAAGQQFGSTLEKARSSSLRWAHMEADAAAAAAAGAGPVSEVNLQPFRPDADRLNSGSEGDADEKGAQQGTR